jgi:hypothetical protein
VLGERKVGHLLVKYEDEIRYRMVALELTNLYH